MESAQRLNWGWGVGGHILGMSPSSETKTATIIVTVMLSPSAKHFTLQGTMAMLRALTLPWQFWEGYVVIIPS